MVCFGQNGTFYWGKQRSSGVLLGREKSPLDRRGAPTKEERENAKDYRDYVGLYCLYGEGEIIYVGEAGLGSEKKIFDRLREHRKDSLSGRWDSFSWFGRASCDGQSDVKTSLAHLEAITIAIINPGHNKQSGAFAGAVQVFQVPHEKAEGDLETKINRLTDLVSELKNKQDNGKK
jgi:hypothetical protein